MSNYRLKQIFEDERAAWESLEEQYAEYLRKICKIMGTPADYEWRDVLLSEDLPE